MNSLEACASRLRGRWPAWLVPSGPVPGFLWATEEAHHLRHRGVHSAFLFLVPVSCSASQPLTPSMALCLPCSPLSVKSRHSKRCPQAWTLSPMVICSSNLVERVHSSPSPRHAHSWANTDTNDGQLVEADRSPASVPGSLVLRMRSLTGAWGLREGRFPLA